MIFKETPASTGYEILYNSHYVAIPMTIKASMKAGTPVDATGASANTASAVGVLLHDVDVERNPNGTVVIHGFINRVNAQRHSEVTVSTEAENAMTAIKFIPLGQA